MDGILNVYKERGYTSHDVVAKLRGILKQRKIGHTGTLDPEAEGVLPVCLGKATKLCDMLTDKRKTYETVLLLGRVTDTQDIHGDVLAENQERAAALTKEDICLAVKSFEGEQLQIPPMYSALKVNGKKLYELAREGKEIERPARPVCFYEITITAINLPRVSLRVTCSKGTYIRTLCHDLGEKLGCGGCMEQLLRTKVERFSVSDAKKLSEIEAMAREGSLFGILTDIEEMFSALSDVFCVPESDCLLYNGNPLSIERTVCEVRLKAGEQVRMYDSRRVFIGIFRFEEEKARLKPVKMFYQA